MMSLLNQTKLESWDKTQSTLGLRQKSVYEALVRHPNVSNRDLSIILEKPINQITPRVNELRELGLVKFSGVKFDQFTKRRVNTWSIV